MKKITEDIPASVQEKFDLFSYNGAFEILKALHSEEFDEIMNALSGFQTTLDELKEQGGNESTIPKRFDDLLYSAKWEELKITADLLVHYAVRLNQKSKKFDPLPDRDETIKDYIDGHFVDFVKNRVALDLEWNGKDQTFDRDLMAFRAFYDAGIIDCAVLITRSESLNDIFRTVTYTKSGKNGKVSTEKLISKYGASTTWIGKLLTRLDAHRAGGCPVLAVGIRKEAVIDWSENNG